MKSSAIILLFLGASLWRAYGQQTYSLESYDPPSLSGTTLVGINNLGQATGQSGLDILHDFVVDIDTKALTPIRTLDSGGLLRRSSPFLFTFSGVGGINDSNSLIFYEGGTSNLTSNYGGIYTQFGYPPAAHTTGFGINNAGDISGSWVDLAGASHGFLRRSDGTYTSFDPPFQLTDQTTKGINSSGTIVGFYYNANVSMGHSFIRSPGGAIERFDAPPDPGQTANYTQANGVNSEGEIVGSLYQEPAKRARGFIRSPDGKTYTSLSFPGAEWTFPMGINDAGVIVGAYGLGTQLHGFIARPDPGSVELSYSSWTFAVHPVGETSGPGHVAVTNKTAAQLSVSFSLAGSSPADFAITSNDCTAPLAPGAHCTVYFNFTPLTGGFRTASLLVIDNFSTSPQSVALGGQGLGPVLEVSPSSFQFAPHAVGETSGPGKIFLFSHGGTPVALGGIALSGANPGDFSFTNGCPPVIPSGTTCSLTVTTTPTAMGPRSATLSVTTNSPQPIPAVSLLEYAKVEPSSETIYVLDTDNHRVQTFDATNKYLGQFDPGFDIPVGISLGKNGDVFVKDGNQHCNVDRFDSTGVLGLQIGHCATNGTGPGVMDNTGTVAVDSNGDIWVSSPDFYYMQKFDRDGNFLAIICMAKTGLACPVATPFDVQPWGIAFDREGNIYVTNGDPFSGKNSVVVKFDSAGNYMASFGSVGSNDGEFRDPYNIAIDSSGYLFVADSYNRRIQKFDSNGVFVAKFGSDQLSYPTGLAFDVNGNLYVSDAGSYNDVQVFNTENVSIAKFGSSGSGNGKFNAPYGVAIRY